MEGYSTYEERYELPKKVRLMMTSSYRGLQLPCVIWYRDLHLPLDATAVDFELFEVVEESPRSVKKVPISTKDSLEPGINQERFPLRVLVEGWPFCGKTTYCYRMAMDWSRDREYLLRFNFVFYINTKYLNQTKQTFEEFMIEEASMHKVDKAVTKRMLRDKASAALIMIDEVDDCSQEMYQKMLPFLTREIYAEATVMVFSRTGDFPPPGKKWGVASLFSLWNSKKIKWDKRIYHGGLNHELRVAFLEKYLTDSFPLQGLHSRVAHLFNPYMEGIYRYPMYLLLMCRNLESSEFKFPRTRTDLYKAFLHDATKHYDTLSKNQREVTIELYDIKDKRPPYTDLFNYFGELCFQKIQNDDVTFTEAEILQHCRDNVILSLGLVGKELYHTKQSQPAPYRPLHFTLTDFCAMYHVWTISYESEKKFQSIVSEKLKPSYVNGNKRYEWFFPFLVGLLDDRASLVLQLLIPEAILYHADFDFLFDLINQLERLDNVLNLLLKFLPTEWWIHWQGPMRREFIQSPLHCTLLTHALEKNHVNILKWHIGMDASLPENVEVDRLELTIEMKSLDGLKTLLKSVKKIDCREFVCYYDGQKARVYYDQFISFVNRVNKDSFILHLYDCDFVKLMQYICRETKDGQVKKLGLHCTIRERNEDFVKSFCEVVATETILESLSVTIWPYYVKQDDFVKLTSDLEKILEAIYKNKNLRELSIHGDCEVPLTVSLGHLCSGREAIWNYLGLDTVTVVDTDALTKLNVKRLELQDVVLSKESLPSLLKAISGIMHLTVDGNLLCRTSGIKLGTPLEFLHIRMYGLIPKLFGKIIHFVERTKNIAFDFSVPVVSPSVEDREIATFFEHATELETLSLFDPPGHVLDAFLQAINPRPSSWLSKGYQETPNHDQKPLVKTFELFTDLETVTSLVLKQLKRFLKIRRIDTLRLIVLRTCFSRDVAIKLLNEFPPPEFRSKCTYDSNLFGTPPNHRTVHVPQHHVIHITCAS